jgi:hypothetical protein
MNHVSGSSLLRLCFVDTTGTASRSPLTPDEGVSGESGTDTTSGVTALYQAHGPRSQQHSHTSQIYKRLPCWMITKIPGYMRQPKHLNRVSS